MPAGINALFKDRW